MILSIMSEKFKKNRSVDETYMNIPLRYTSILHPQNKNRELVLIDKLGDNYLAAYRNNITCKVGRTFLLKALDNGFVFKDKGYHFNGNNGLVW